MKPSFLNWWIINHGKNSSINANEIQGDLSFQNSVFKMSLEVNITGALRVEKYNLSSCHYEVEIKIERKVSWF